MWRDEYCPTVFYNEHGGLKAAEEEEKAGQLRRRANDATGRGERRLPYCLLRAGGGHAVSAST